MYCPKCGRELPADGSPCVCERENREQTGAAGDGGGSASSADRAVTPPREAGPPVLSRTPAHEALCALAGSPLFLIAAVLSTLATVLSIVRAFLERHPLQAMLPGGNTFDRLTQMRMNEIALILAASVLPLLACAAFWMIFAAGRRKKAARFGTAGLTFLRVLTVIFAVAVTLLAILLAAAVVLQLSQHAGQVDWPSVAGVGPQGLFRQFAGDPDHMGLCVFDTLLLVGVLLLWGFVFFLCMRVLHSLKAAKRMALSGIARRKASVFLAVVCILRFAVEFIDLYGQFLLNGPLSAAETACSAFASLFFAILIFRFNGAVKRLRPAEAPGV